jgi:hypothetical protein
MLADIDGPGGWRRFVEAFQRPSYSLLVKAYVVVQSPAGVLAKRRAIRKTRRLRKDGNLVQAYGISARELALKD